MQDKYPVQYDSSKRFLVFFPPEIIFLNKPKIETGKSLVIELEIRANPFNKDEKAKQIEATVIFSREIYS